MCIWTLLGVIGGFIFSPIVAALIMLDVPYHGIIILCMFLIEIFFMVKSKDK